jgi:hypothetical protein
VKAAAYCGSKTDIKCSVYDTRWCTPFTILANSLTLHLDAIFDLIMNHFLNFGFATPDGVATHMRILEDATFHQQLTPIALGQFLLVRMPHLSCCLSSLIGITRRLERRFASIVGCRHSVGSRSIRSTFTHQLSSIAAFVSVYNNTVNQGNIHF